MLFPWHVFDRTDAFLKRQDRYKVYWHNEYTSGGYPALLQCLQETTSDCATYTDVLRRCFADHPVELERWEGLVSAMEGNLALTKSFLQPASGVAPSYPELIIAGLSYTLTMIGIVRDAMSAGNTEAAA